MTGTTAAPPATIATPIRPPKTIPPGQADQQRGPQGAGGEGQQRQEEQQSDGDRDYGDRDGRAQDLGTGAVDHRLQGEGHADAGGGDGIEDIHACSSS